MRTLPMAATHLERSQRMRLAPRRLWAPLRVAGVVVCLGLCLEAIRLPSLSLMLFWRVFVPLAPLVFLVAPGLWRNVCPMATLNSLPSRLGWSRGGRLPLRVQRIAPAISACLFCAIVPLRRVILDQSGVALAIFVLLLLGLAFTSGLLFGGKGGWCSHFCPMGTVERLYGQSPLLVIRDTQCRSCVGCAQHCYDLHPTRAALVETYSADNAPHRARLAFSGALVWLIAAFFTQPALSHPTLEGIVLLYGHLWVPAAIGAGLALVLPACSGISPQQIVRIHAMLAFNLYCLFALPTIADHAPQLVLLQLAGTTLLSCLWLATSVRRERIFVALRFLGQARPQRRVPAAAGAGRAEAISAAAACAAGPVPAA